MQWQVDTFSQHHSVLKIWCLNWISFCVLPNAKRDYFTKCVLFVICVSVWSLSNHNFFEIQMWAIKWKWNFKKDSIYVQDFQTKSSSPSQTIKFPCEGWPDQENLNVKSVYVLYFYLAGCGHYLGSGDQCSVGTGMSRPGDWPVLCCK